MTTPQNNTISEDSFMDDFCPFDMSSDGDQVEPSLEQTKKIMAEKGLSDSHIWTLVDDGEGSLYASAGVHFVNRVGFLVTEKPWVTGDEIAVWYEVEEDEEEPED
jgi:hypothetical protein